MRSQTLALGRAGAGQVQAAKGGCALTRRAGRFEAESHELERLIPSTGGSHMTSLIHFISLAF